jgi:chromosome segregation ATPase
MVVDIGPAEKKRSNQMMKRQVIFICMIALVFPLLSTGCYRAELTRVEAELEQTELERDHLRSRLEAVEQSQQQTGETETAEAPGRWQQQFDEFLKIRNALQQREDELARLRLTALAEAETARSLMDELAAQLQAETEKVNEVQNQLEQAQQAIGELQDRLKQ